MVTRIIIAIIVVALAATSAQALGPVPDRGFVGDNFSIKVDIRKFAIGFPFEFTALDLCVMPVTMNVGFFVQVEDCASKKILLRQVDCGDIDRPAEDWPCYFDCETVRIRANFEVKLGLKLKKESSVIEEWEAFFEDKDTVSPSGAFEEVKVCVKAWKAQLQKHAPGSEVKVGTLTITVKPNV